MAIAIFSDGHGQSRHRIDIGLFIRQPLGFPSVICPLFAVSREPL